MMLHGRTFVGIREHISIGHVIQYKDIYVDMKSDDSRNNKAKWPLYDMSDYQKQPLRILYMGK